MAGRRQRVLLPDRWAAHGRQREHQRRQKEAILAFGPAYADKSIVFASGVGKRIDSANLQRAWRAICSRAGLRYRFHDLRHLHASELLRNGVHPKVVQERLGHSKISTTLDTYSHVLPTMQQTASVRFDEMFASVPES